MDSKKGLIVYMVVTALAMALTACAKGFKTEDIKSINKVDVVTPRGGGGPYVAPEHQIQISNSMPIINFMADQNPDVMTILNDPNFVPPANIAGRIALKLVNLPIDNFVNTGAGSQLRFQGILQAATGVEIRMDSTDARVSLDRTGTIPKITGTWTYPTSTGRVTLAIEGQPVRANFVSTVGAFNLEGTLYGAFGGADESEVLGTFSIPLCSIMQNTAWVNEPAALCTVANP